MKFLINCSSLKVGGGLQVAHSFIHELVNYPQHDFCVVITPNLAKQINQNHFPGNVKFIEYDIQPSIYKVITGKDHFLSNIENNFKPQAVFSVFGAAYWKPKVNHICGFARPDFIYKESPFFKITSWKNNLKTNVLQFFHLYDFKHHTQCIITENIDVTQHLQQKIPHKAIVTITNNYNQVFNQPKYWDNTPALSNDSETFKLLTISANYPHKNIAIIKQVIPYLTDKYPDFRFKFYVSISPEQIGVQANDPLNKHITFLGTVAVNQCPHLYEQTDALFLPTLLECFSASYCEAMYMKRPILTSNLSFAKGICDQAALYFDPLNPEDIADKIYQLAHNPSLQKQLVEQGIQQLTTFDTTTQRAQKYIDLLEKYS